MRTLQRPASSPRQPIHRTGGRVIDRHAVSLLGTPATPIIRIADHAMFASGSAVVQAASLPLLERISVALRNESGSLRVIDYTDNQPVGTVQFPSNFQPSAARANAVPAIMVRIVGAPARISAEGRADADPVAPNTTAEGPRAEPADRDRAVP